MEAQHVENPAAAASGATGPVGEKLSLWRKIGFGVGDIFGGGSGVIISFYYLYFLTDVVRINPALAGTTFLISKIYDAITDPFEGVITDRTRTPLGRRRPYLLAGVLLVFLSFFLLWYPVGFESEAGRFAFMLGAYLFFSTVVSIVMVSYNALASELTLDYHERTSISSSRIFFSTVSSVLSAVLPLEIVKAFPDARTGYMIMALVFGAFYALPFLITVAATRERPEFQKPVRHGIHLRALFIDPFGVRAFVFVLFLYLLAFTAMDTVSSIVIYFMKYYLGRGSEANFVSGALLVAQVVSLPFYVILSRRTSKRVGYITGALIWLATMLTSFLLTPASPAWGVYVFAVLVGFGTGGIVLTIYAIFPDIPDIDELQSGERREGTYSALVTFMRKFSSAIAIFLVSNLLAVTGYVQPTAQVVDGVQQIVEQPQTDAFLLALRLIFVVVPVVLLGAALWFAWRYPLSPAVHQRLNQLLAQRRSGAEEDAQMQQESAALTRLLIR